MKSIGQTDNVGIVTLYRGYNYGTSLQAYALKKVICELGYKADIIWTNENTHLEHDIRFGKLVKMIFRMSIYPNLRKNTIQAYSSRLKLKLENDIKHKFLNFEKEYLQVLGLKMSELQEYARSSTTKAIVCGSDQIWSAMTANIEPLYYLRFAPKQKRIAYAPSFGTSCIPIYNKKRIAHYISDIPYISVRENQGARIVKELTGREVPILLDPTLLLDWQEWKENKAEQKYILVYFLDQPTDIVIEKVNLLNIKYKYDVIVLPYQFACYRAMNNVSFSKAGPIELINLIKNAKCVITDSFHGVALSVNFNIPFYVFPRNYGGSNSQGSRILSMLNIFQLDSQYMNDNDIDKMIEIPNIDYHSTNSTLEYLRNKSIDWLKNAIESASAVL